MTQEQRKQIIGDFIIKGVSIEHIREILKFFKDEGCEKTEDCPIHINYYYYYDVELKKVFYFSNLIREALISLSALKNLMNSIPITYTYEPITETLMYVSDRPFAEQKNIEKRIVFGKKNGKFLAWSGSKTMQLAQKATDITIWSYVQKVEKAVTITSDEAQKIVNIACNEWKAKLFNLWGLKVFLNEDIEVTENQILEFIGAANKNQKVVLKEIFNK